MTRHREFMRHLFRIANQGVQLARIVIGTSHDRFSPDINALNVAQHLVQDVDGMTVSVSNVPHQWSHE
jgi:hypothetical protein